MLLVTYYYGRAIHNIHHYSSAEYRVCGSQPYLVLTRKREGINLKIKALHGYVMRQSNGYNITITLIILARQLEFNAMLCARQP